MNAPREWQQAKLNEDAQKDKEESEARGGWAHAVRPLQHRSHARQCDGFAVHISSFTLLILPIYNVLVLYPQWLFATFSYFSRSLELFYSLPLPPVSSQPTRRLGRSGSRCVVTTIFRSAPAAAATDNVRVGARAVDSLLSTSGFSREAHINRILISIAFRFNFSFSLFHTHTTRWGRHGLIGPGVTLAPINDLRFGFLIG